jgi:hypothetical protein
MELSKDPAGAPRYSKLGHSINTRNDHALRRVSMPQSNPAASSLLRHFRSCACAMLSMAMALHQSLDILAPPLAVASASRLPSKIRLGARCSPSWARCSEASPTRSATACCRPVPQLGRSVEAMGIIVGTIQIAFTFLADTRFPRLATQHRPVRPCALGP